MKKTLLFTVIATFLIGNCLCVFPSYGQIAMNVCDKKLPKATIKSALDAYRHLEEKTYELAALEICKIEQTKRIRKKIANEKWPQFSLLYNWTKANLYVQHYKPLNIHSAIHHAELAKNIAEKNITDEYLQIFIDSLQTPPCPKANSLCDDDNPETINDREDGDCNCLGEVPPPPPPIPIPPAKPSFGVIADKIDVKKEEVRSQVNKEMGNLMSSDSKPSKSNKDEIVKDGVNKLVLKSSKIGNKDTTDAKKTEKKAIIPEATTIAAKKEVAQRPNVDVSVPDCAEDLNPLDLRVVFEYTDKGDGISTFAALKKTEYTNRFISKALEVLQETLDEQYKNLPSSKKIKGFITGYATNQPVSNVLNINGKYINGLFYNKEFGELPKLTYKSVIGKDIARVTYDGGKYGSLIESQEELAFVRAYSVKFRLSNGSSYIENEDINIVTSIVDNEKDGGKVQITLDIENAFNVYLSDLNSEMKKEFIEEAKKKCVFRP